MWGWRSPGVRWIWSEHHINWAAEFRTLDLIASALWRLRWQNVVQRPGFLMTMRYVVNIWGGYPHFLIVLASAV